jgi:hypothetical protein
MIKSQASVYSLVVLKVVVLDLSFLVEDSSAP